MPAVNTNAAWLGEQLGLAGVTVTRMEPAGRPMTRNAAVSAGALIVART